MIKSEIMDNFPILNTSLLFLFPQFATVYKARDVVRDRIVAVKKVRREIKYRHFNH